MKKNIQEFLSWQVMGWNISKSDLENQISHFVRDHHHPVVKHTKISLNTFPFGKNLINFVSPGLKLHNRNCHITYAAKAVAWWLLHFIWFLSTILTNIKYRMLCSYSPVIKYGNTGCWVFKGGVQNKKDFCLKIHWPKGNYWNSKIVIVGKYQKERKFDFFMSKIIGMFLFSLKSK